MYHLHLVLLLVAAGITLAGCSSPGSAHNSEAQSAAASSAEIGSVILASPGRVEGRTEAVEVGAAVDGVISRVYVEEGQAVRRGAKLADINCSDLIANHRAAIAESESARQARARLIRGSRDEERLAAEQRTTASRAILHQAEAQIARTKQMFEGGDVSKARVDETQRDYEVAEARLKEAIRSEELIKASPVTEDLAKADADVAAADERIQIALAKLAKCNVEAPMDGTILRVLMRPGEAFSTITPQPLLTMADLSARRVRAEIDERDVAKVRVGQNVQVSTDAHEQKFRGVVLSIATTMGRKKVRTGDPAEKADRDVLEALVRMEDSAARLPVGIRVVVHFLR